MIGVVATLKVQDGKQAEFEATSSRSSAPSGALPARKSATHWAFVVSTRRFVAARKYVNAFSSGATSGRATANSASSAGAGSSRLASQPNAARPPIATAMAAAAHDRILFMAASLAFARFPDNGNGRRTIFT